MNESIFLAVLTLIALLFTPAVLLVGPHCASRARTFIPFYGMYCLLCILMVALLAAKGYFR